MINLLLSAATDSYSAANASAAAIAAVHAQV